MPLRYLFVDMNSYFASVEQQDRPRLRGRPVAVVPVQAQSTCCLAASYEAKAFGVRTGTPVWRARALCRDLELVPARPARYGELHGEIVRAVGKCVPVERVLSVDEMACKLLHLHNVFTVAQLCSLSVKQLSQVWGSVIHGERWYYQLRGDEVYERPTVRRTLGQSNVLPPEHRTESGSRAVLVRLVHKACGRLRDIGYWASHRYAGVSYLGAGRRWEASTALAPCQDTLTVLQAFAALWERRPRDAELTPLKVEVTLSRLTATLSTTPSLFDEDRCRAALAQAMDAINKCFGRNSVYFGAQSGAGDAAPLRIPFGTPPVNSPAYQ